VRDCWRVWPQIPQWIGKLLRPRHAAVFVDPAGAVRRQVGGVCFCRHASALVFAVAVGCWQGWKSHLGTRQLDHLAQSGFRGIVAGFNPGHCSNYRLPRLTLENCIDKDWPPLEMVMPARNLVGVNLLSGLVQKVHGGYLKVLRGNRK